MEAARMVVELIDHERGVCADLEAVLHAERQALTAFSADAVAGCVRRKDALQSELRPRGIFERSEGAVRTAEGLSPRRGVLAGDVPEEVTVREHGLTFTVLPAGGQKTGFFLDQAPNRALLQRLASGRPELHLYGEALSRATAMGATRFHVSLTHDQLVSVAVVVLETG